MQFGRRRTRKRPYKSPRDRTAEAANLRIVGELLKRRKPAKGLSWANHVLATPGLHKHKQSRVLALVGDSEFKRGAFDEAARIYQRELQYLEKGLRAIPDSVSMRIAMLHYPPFNADLQPNAFADILQAHNVDILLLAPLRRGAKGRD